MLEMRELSYTTSKSGRRIPFKRMDTYSYGTIIEVSDSSVSFTYSKQSMTFICAQEHFDDMYDILTTTHREKHKRIFGYRTTGSICVEITESDIATVDIADISELVTYINRKITRLSFI